MTCSLARLVITDGQFTVNLLDPAGFHAVSWTPTIALFKGGGVIGSSPFVDGARPVFGVYDAVEEDITITVTGVNIDGMAYRMQNLRRLLRQASVFWYGRAGSATYPHITGVVWVEARVHGETNTRYAVLLGGSIANDGQVIGQPIIQNDGGSVMSDLHLRFSRLHWTSNRPGVGSSIEMVSVFFFHGTLYGTVDEDQVATDTTEPVFLANKHSVSNITNVHNGTGGSNLLDGPFPVTLFDGATELYIGCTELNQPISNLIFDIGTAGQAASVNITWEYMSAAGPTWTSLANVQDNTFDFLVAGINSVTFTQPTFHTGTSPGGGLPTGIWIRARISSGSYTTDPTQQNRNIYSQVNGYASININQVDGDVPALSRLTFRNPGNVLGTTRAVNRVIGGLKTVGNHEIYGAQSWNFTHIVNFSEQNPTGWTASGNITAVQDAGTGRAITGTTLADTGFNTAGDAILILDDAISNQYTGDFRLFIRASSTLNTADGYTAPLHGRVKVSTYNAFNQTANTTYARTEPILYDVCHLVDFGIVSLPPGGTGTEYLPRTIGRVEFSVQLRNDHASNDADWVLYDMILIPVNEWSFEAVATSPAVGSELGIHSRLIIDGIGSGVPRAYTVYDGVSYLGVADGTELTPWMLIENGHPRLNTQVAQRICIISSYETLGAIWESRPNVLLSAQYETNEQYLGLIGSGGS